MVTNNYILPIALSLFLESLCLLTGLPSFLDTLFVQMSVSISLFWLHLQLEVCMVSFKPH